VACSGTIEVNETQPCPQGALPMDGCLSSNPHGHHCMLPNAQCPAHSRGKIESCLGDSDVNLGGETARKRGKR
jgi:hypothetical protein